MNEHLNDDYHYIAYKIKPVPKPRQTQSDRWKKRPCVVRYHAFKDECRKYNINVPDSGSHIVFVLPMAKSWSKNKKQEHNGQPHKQKPDTDNMVKALFDALFSEDEHIWDFRATKIWGEEPLILVGVKKDTTNT